MNLIPIDRHLLGCLVAAGGEGSLNALFMDMHQIKFDGSLFAHRAVQRLQQAGLIEHDGDRIRLVNSASLLDECAQAILTAIFSEDGLDAAVGEALLRKMNRWPSDGEGGAMPDFTDLDAWINLRKERDEALEAMTRLRKALKRYGRHEESCPALQAGPCCCGLSIARLDLGSFGLPEDP